MAHNIHTPGYMHDYLAWADPALIQGGVTTHKWVLLIYIYITLKAFFYNFFLKYLISCQFNIKREIFNISFVCKNSDLSSCKQMK